MKIKPIVMPQWGLTMSEGTIVHWHVAEGDLVKPGDELVEIETTKITNVVEADFEGVVRRRLGECGATYPCGSLLAVVAAGDVSDADVEELVKAHSIAASTEAVAERARTLDVGGTSINYFDCGTGTETVLFLHGFGGNLENWAAVQDPASLPARLISLDLPGHGSSSKTMSGMSGFADVASIVSAVLAELEIDKVHIVAHSMGAVVAAAFTQQAALEVASLTLVAPVGAGGAVNPAYIEQFLSARTRRETMAALEMLFASRHPPLRELADQMLKFKRIDGVDESLRTYRRWLDDVGVRNLLADVQLPKVCTALWGIEDRIIPPLGAEHLPSGCSRLLLPDVGHMPQVEIPEAVKAHLQTILAAS